jgi:RNA polymerase sigma-70 factor, ECF subfamily
MLTSISTFEDSGFSPVAAIKTQAVTRAADRLEEFENILSHALPRFRRMAMRWLRNHEDAEDAVQDAMLSAFRHLDHFDGRSQMSTWLTAILLNAVRMQIRRRSKVKMLPLEHGPEDEPRNISETVPDPRPTPEQNIEQQELRELVAKLANNLPRPQKTVLRLRLRDDLSIQDLVETLGLPEGTVKAQLARGRAKLIERFHRITSTGAPQISKTESKSKRKAVSEYRPDDAQSFADLPIAAFAEQGGYNGWVGA